MKRFIAATLLALLCIAASPEPEDSGTGLTYDTISITVLAHSDVIAGKVNAIVLQARWSDGTPASIASGGLIARWPMLDEHTARTTDAVSLTTTKSDGVFILAYTTPPEVLLASEESADALLDIWILAFRENAFPKVGFGKYAQAVTVIRG